MQIHKTFPFNTLSKFIGSTIYGGHVTDTYDLRLITTLFECTLNGDVLNFFDDYNLFNSANNQAAGNVKFRVPLPKANHSQCMKFINEQLFPGSTKSDGISGDFNKANLASGGAAGLGGHSSAAHQQFTNILYGIDPATTYGLHPNAEIGFFIEESHLLLKSVTHLRSGIHRIGNSNYDSDIFLGMGSNANQQAQNGNTTTQGQNATSAIANKDMEEIASPTKDDQGDDMLGLGGDKKTEEVNEKEVDVGGVVKTQINVGQVKNTYAQYKLDSMSN